MKGKNELKTIKILMLLLVPLLLARCSSAPRPAAEPVLDTSRITALVQAQSAGLSPNNDGFKDGIEFFLYTEQRESLISWKLELSHSLKGVQKVFTGKSDLPATLVWDGQGRSGQAPEGLYRAVLTIEYANGSAPVTAQSAQFGLDLSAPAVVLSLSPVPFSPDGDGENDEISIFIQADDPSGVDSWSLDILDPKQNYFIGFSGRGNPAKPLIWNGRSAAGELVQSADDYTLAATVRDTLGNTAAATRDLPVDVLVIRDGDRLKIVITSITFPPYSADFTKVSAEEVRENSFVLKRLAEILKKFARYKITIEGHAVMVYWYEAVKGEEEHKEVLLPLSKSRAEAVKKALVGQGVEEARMTATGIGGSRPIVPFSDLENRWKNRRVEFILTKE